MIKRFCNICGEEIKNDTESWTQSLTPNEGNKRRVPNETQTEICATCATKIDCCITMIRYGYEINYHHPKSQECTTKADKTIIWH